MRYSVHAGGRALAIESTPDGRFLVGGRVIAADVRAIARGRLWSVIVDGEAHEVAFLGGDPPRMSVDGLEVRVQIADERPIAAGAAGTPSGSTREEIRAPMPGLLKAVHVLEGAKVAAGDALVTLEAMKMENELRAAHAGTVAQVTAAEGTKVESGALLVVIRPE
ncbi:MAG TPA: biotin/lipoyl-containing protein [Candidatus Limnocylindria bacterium]|nr:biotin/lipoyl-containing protein [Candidatus Limnocylindria bacterium]